MGSTETLRSDAWLFRHLELPIASRSGNDFVLRTPQSAKEAPLGYYMLFLLDEKGVPSTAKWVQLRPGA